jgi:hypothetical protein
MPKIFALGLIFFVTTIFSANKQVLKTDGPDLFPLMFRLSSGSINVIWECEKYLGDYDIIYAKYYNNKWIETPRGAGWPYADPYVNHHHPALAVGLFDDLYVCAVGPFPPSDTIGDNFFWATSTDSDYTWQVKWILDSKWFKDCSSPAAAIEEPDMYIVFQDNQDKNNPDIRAWYFLGGQPQRTFNVAVESYPETNPVVTASSSGFAIAYEAKPGGSWDIYAKKPQGLIIGSPIAIATDPSKDELHPYLASSDHYCYCAYTKGGDVYVAYSIDGGSTYKSVAVATSAQKEDWPAVACDGRKVDVAYYHGSGNIYHQHSNDNGATWSAPDIVTTSPTAVDTTRIAMLFDNPCHIIWVDKRDGSPNLYYGRAGASAADEVSVTAVPDIKVSPNPFTTKTMIEYSTGSIEIYNVEGRLVQKFAGPGPRVFDGSNLAAGIYFIDFKHSAGTKTCKAILLK